MSGGASTVLLSPLIVSAIIVDAAIVNATMGPPAYWPTIGILASHRSLYSGSGIVPRSARFRCHGCASFSARRRDECASAARVFVNYPANAHDISKICG
jgi:hypothetical protein